MNGNVYNNYCTEIISLFKNATFDIINGSEFDSSRLDVSIIDEYIDFSVNDLGFLSNFSMSKEIDLNYLGIVNFQETMDSIQQDVNCFFDILFSEPILKNLFSPYTTLYTNNLYEIIKVKKILKPSLGNIFYKFFFGINSNDFRFLMRGNERYKHFKLLLDNTDYSIFQFNLFKITKNKKIVLTPIFKFPYSNYNNYFAYNYDNHQFYFVDKNCFYFEDFFELNNIFDSKIHFKYILQPILKSIIDNFPIELKNDLNELDDIDEIINLIKMYLI